MPRLILLAGPSGSGKSTYRERLLAASPGTVAISGDDIIEEWCAEGGLKYQDVYLKFKEASKDELARRLSDSLREGRDIVWDQTNLTEDIRRDALSRIPDHYDVIAVGFEAPLSLVLERVADREKSGGKGVPEDVVRLQHAAYSRPHFDEGFDSVVVIHEPGMRAEVIT